MTVDWSRLRMGVDVLTDTQWDDVKHTYGEEPPEYTLEIEDEDGDWRHYCDVSAEDLPLMVEAMHHGFTDPVRLVENGYPVFGCYR